MKQNISVKLGNTLLNSPLIIGANDSILDFKTFNLIAENSKLLGAFVTKSFTLDARQGNKNPIVSCVDNNLMVSSGMRNPGLKQMLTEISNYHKQHSTPQLIPSIAINPDSAHKDPIAELTFLATQLYENGVNIIELNLSCPNLNTSTIVADKQGMVYRIINQIKNEFSKKNYSCTLIAKLAGDDNALLNSAKQAEDSEIDAITILPLLRATSFYTGLIKQHQPMAIGDPLLGNIHGTIYGSGFGPITRQYLLNLKAYIKTPIIASGGCLGGFNSTIIEKTDGLVQTMFAGAIATEVVTPFYPFNQEKLQEIDEILNQYNQFVTNNSTLF